MLLVTRQVMRNDLSNMLSSASKELCCVCGELCLKTVDQASSQPQASPSISWLASVASATAVYLYLVEYTKSRWLSKYDEVGIQTQICSRINLWLVMVFELIHF